MADEENAKSTEPESSDQPAPVPAEEGPPTAAEEVSKDIKQVRTILRSSSTQLLSISYQCMNHI